MRRRDGTPAPVAPGHRPTKDTMGASVLRGRAWWGLTERARGPARAWVLSGPMRRRGPGPVRVRKRRWARTGQESRRTFTEVTDQLPARARMAEQVVAALRAEGSPNSGGPNEAEGHVADRELGPDMASVAAMSPPGRRAAEMSAPPPPRLARLARYTGTSSRSRLSPGESGRRGLGHGEQARNTDGRVREKGNDCDTCRCRADSSHLFCFISGDGA